MGLGSTAKKLQTVADTAEKLYTQLQDVRERMVGLEEDAEQTAARVRYLEVELAEQRAILEALAQQAGVDAEAAVAAADTEPPEPPTVDDGDAGESDAGATPGE